MSELKFDIDEKRIKDNFIEMVAVPCPSLDEKAEAELLVKKLEALGMEVSIDKAGEKCDGTTGNVWGFLPANVEGATAVFFEAHMDAVAPTTGTTVITKDGVMYSDGTTTLGGDDKSGVAAALEAVQVVVENNIPHGDIQICFAIGEEIGSYGMRYMDKEWIKADVGYCLDCGGKPGMIYNRAPKAIDLYCTVSGKTAHAGLEPEKGINAIMLAAKALSSLPWYGRLDAETTMSVDMIDGGLAANIVPDKCSFVIDMRCLDEAKLTKITSDVTACMKAVVEAAGGTIEFEEKGVSPAVAVDEDAPAVKLAARGGELCGFNVTTQASGGCSDANFLCGMGLPTILLATGMDKIHTTEERLAEIDLFNAARWALGIIVAAAE